MNKYVHIVVFPTQKDQLDKMKVIDEESYHRVIGRLIEFYTEHQEGSKK